MPAKDRIVSTDEFVGALRIERSLRKRQPQSGTAKRRYRDPQRGQHDQQSLHGREDEDRVELRQVRGPRQRVVASR